MIDRHALPKVAAGSALPLAALVRPAKSFVLKLVPQAAVSTLNPIFTTAAATQSHACCGFDTLYCLDTELEPLPQTAAGHTVSADGRAWEITLRDDLTFHDGTPVSPPFGRDPIRRRGQRPRRAARRPPAFRRPAEASSPGSSRDVLPSHGVSGAPERRPASAVASL